MNNLHEGLTTFRNYIFPHESALYRKLASEGQSPHALFISCADSRVMPETITQSGPGELFVCRNAGNIVPPFATANGGVSSAIEYAVIALRVRDIVVCGHSQCGAMNALCHPHLLDPMPNVAAWLRHSKAAQAIICEAYPSDMSDEQRALALGMENVIVQLDHLRTHPSVAARLATGELTLHGWFFEIETGEVKVYDGMAGRFVAAAPDRPLPTAITGRGSQRVTPSRPTVLKTAAE